MRPTEIRFEPKEGGYEVRAYRKVKGGKVRCDSKPLQVVMVDNEFQADLKEWYESIDPRLVPKTSE